MFFILGFSWDIVSSKIAGHLSFYVKMTSCTSKIIFVQKMCMIDLLWDINVKLVLFPGRSSLVTLCISYNLGQMSVGFQCCLISL